jgi:hypothetical protein
MSQSGRDPVVRKNHIVSHCDILLSLDLKFKEQEGAGPTIIEISNSVVIRHPLYYIELSKREGSGGGDVSPSDIPSIERDI